MKLIAGLGNPGEKYFNTRHNLGFMVVDQFLKDFESAENTVWQNEPKFKSDIVHIDWQPKERPAEKIILVKPKTFMNNSGMAISLIKDFYKIPVEDIWIVYDDIDLPVGNFRIRHGGGSGGHRGVESMIESLGTDGFWRFRMGIGRPEMVSGEKGVDDYVLGKFSSHEHGAIKELISKGTKALQEALENGLLSAMNTYNTK